MKLYYSPGACSLSPHIVLRELGLDFQLEKVDLAAKKTETGADFRRVNPKGYVPALQLDGGEVLTEGPAIVQYLADRKPEAGLAPPAGTMARYRLQEWLNFISTELHKPFSPLFNPTTPADARKQQIERIGARFELVSKALDGKSYIFGDKFSVADAYLFTISNWAKPVQMDLGPWPAILAYRKRIGERPAVQQALVAEGLVKK